MTPEAAMAALADARGVIETHPSHWFDGFWDFFVPNRAELETVPSIAVAGDSPPWLAIYWQPAAGPRLDVFVEAKDRRPGSRPRADVPHRPIDHAALRALGADVTFGYWGLHARVERMDALTAIVDALVAIARRGSAASI